MSERRYAFLVGAPRSGTTWLQLLLSQNENVATSQETHLFTSFLAPLEKAWNSYDGNSRKIGLQAVMGSPEFYELLRQIAQNVMDRIGNTPILLEKTPAHVRSAELILKLFPEALFIHVIRDPRAVVNSLIKAGETWGNKWASTDVEKNAKLWKNDVLQGRRISDMTHRYFEIKYEVLLRDGEKSLAALFRFLGIEVTLDDCRTYLEECSLGRLQKGLSKAPWRLEEEPKGFYRSGRIDAWKEELPTRSVRKIEDIGGNLLSDLGYERFVRGSRHSLLEKIMAHRGSPQ